MTFHDQTPDDIPYLESLINQRIISICADYEDYYILNYAIEHRGIVVSNDNYKDFLKRYPYEIRPVVQRFLDCHVMRYAFTENEFRPSAEFIYPDWIDEYEEKPLSVSSDQDVMLNDNDNDRISYFPSGGEETEEEEEDEK